MLWSSLPHKVKLPSVKLVLSGWRFIFIIFLDEMLILTEYFLIIDIIFLFFEGDEAIEPWIFSQLFNLFFESNVMIIL